MHSLNRTATRTCGDCGFTTKPTTPAMAGHILRRHSCDTHRDRLARAQRAAARRAADGPKRACYHKYADHQHGSRAAYVLDRCRCRPCRDANSAAEAERERAKLYGRYDKYVDARPVRAHVLALKDAGIGYKRASQLAGVAYSSIGKLIYGMRRPDGTHRPPCNRILKDTAAKLLSVRPGIDAYAAGAKIDATGTHRRLRALVALGWSQSKLADRLGILPSNFTATMTRPTVTAGTARAVRDLYNELSMRLPPQNTHREKIAAARSRNYAQVRGWKPPLAWDDDQLDAVEFDARDGEELADGYLDESAIIRASSGDRSFTLSAAEKSELVRRMHATGHTLADIGRITGLKPERYFRLADLKETS